MVRTFVYEREMFYLTTHSTHFIYGYMASDIWLRTILIVRKETHCRHIGYSYRLTARVLLYAPSHRQDNTYHGLCYTSRGALACSFMVRWVVGWILHGGLMELFLIPASDKGRDKCYPLCRMLYIKEPLLLIGKISPIVGAAGFFSRQLNGILPYV